MKKLNIYSEHIKNSTIGSIKDNLSNVPDNKKEEILNYLKKGRKLGGFPGILRDVFTGEKICGGWLLYSDGVYSWESDIIYYYEKYNLRLPRDFIDYVCEKMK